MLKRLFLAVALAALPIGAPAQDLPLSTATETSYNARGTISSSTIGLISTRRSDPEFRGFLLGMQEAAIRRTGQPLNVPPLSVESPDDQVRHLLGRGVATVVIDAPDAGAAVSAVELLRESKKQFFLVSESIPSMESRPAVVMNTPVLIATRMALEAIHRANERKGPAFFVAPPVSGIGADRAALVTRAFLQPFDSMAPNIEVEQLDLSIEDLSLPENSVIAVLPPVDSLETLTLLETRFPEALVLLWGESDDVRSAHAEGRFAVRVRPDYTRIFNQGAQELVRLSDLPPLVPATVDRH